MEEIIRLKPAVWERHEDDLHVMTSQHEIRTLSDPDGMVEAFLGLLDSGATIEDLARRLADRFPDIGVDDVAEGVEGLDALGMLESASSESQLTEAQRERFFTNLVFFQCFANLRLAKEEMQRRLLSSTVLVLGTGGLGSAVLMHLVGAGIGHFTLVEPDIVERRNFSRQYIYRHQDLGRPKVERARDWIREFSPTTEVTISNRTIGSSEDVAALLTGIDLVVAAIDTPRMEIASWINRACVAAGVPHVRGGMGVQSHFVSVDPGRSACVECSNMVMFEEQADGGTASVKWRLFERFDQQNRGVGPIAGHIGSLMAMEGLRYLTGFAPPAAAGAMHTFDLSDGGVERIIPWTARPNCPVCAVAGTRRAYPDPRRSETTV
jgi:molybdopterin/thiamine biosynthesis adenylyltransferase